MGRKKRVEDNYWDSEEFEKDQAAAAGGEDQAVAEDEETTASKQPTKNQQKKQQKKSGKKGKQVAEEEEEVEAEAEEEEEAAVEAEEKTQTSTTLGGGGGETASKSKKKKNKKKKKKGEESATTTTEDEEGGEKETPEEASSASAPVSAPASASTTASKSKKKKKGKKGEEPVEEEEEEDSGKSKKGKKKKKGGISSSLAQMILAQRAEEEKRKLEEEARRKEEEEEEQRRIEEEEREAVILLEKKRQKKEKEERRKVEAGVRAEERKRAEALARLEAAGLLPAVGSEGASEKKKRVVYENKKKKQQKPKEEADVTPPTSTPAPSQPKGDSTPTPTPVPSSSASSQPKPKEETSIARPQQKSETTTPPSQQRHQHQSAKKVEQPKKVEKEEEEEESDDDDWENADVHSFITKTRSSWEDEGSVIPKAKKTPATTAAKLGTSPPPKLSPPNVRNKPAPTAAPKATSKPTTASLSNKEKEKEKEKDNENEEAGDGAPEELRSPICCVLGHVDAGKTKILDKIRSSNVQGGEAGGITQQIGATYLPIDNIRQQTEQLNKTGKLSYKVPGLLIIDTPGHESFTNLRSRGSSLCDIAILVVDIHSGLEPQTKESLRLLRDRKTPFVVALNKVDRLYDWKSIPSSPIQATLKKQKKDTLGEYDQRVKDSIVQFAEEGLNAALYYKNSDFKSVVSIVPCSAKTGEGIPDLLMLLVQLTQKMMSKKLLLVSELKCTILEVKVTEGFGTTIDVILSNGVLNQGDTIAVCGRQGAIITNIRSLLTPQPCAEMRVTKSNYIHHKTLKAAQGIKIVAQDLENAVAGTSLMVVKSDSDLEEIKEVVQEDLEKFNKMVEKTGRGVSVQASTLGSLEALLSYLKDNKIPVATVNIGPVHLKDVKRAAVQLEHDKQFAAMLCFDVKVEPDARELAEKDGVRIFTADVIYHLTDQFQKYIDGLKEEKQKAAAEEAVFPCILKLLPEHIYNKRDPIVVGVEVLEGLLRVGTPLVASRGGARVDLGRCSSIEINKKNADKAAKGQEACIKIDPVGTSGSVMQTKPLLGRQFEAQDPVYSKLTRRSLDALRDNFKDELVKNNKELLSVALKLKKVFNIE